MKLSTRVVSEDQHPRGNIPKRVFLVWAVGGVEWWGKEGFGEQVLARGIPTFRIFFNKLLQNM